MKDKNNGLKRLSPAQIEDLKTGKEVCIDGVYFIPKDLRLKKTPKLVKK